MSAVVIVQLLFAAVACLGLWRLCRAQPKIVVAGFLIRALAGQALFWISYLRLPVARSLQLGNGLWFFAIDGPFYLGYATKLAARGPVAILLDPEQYPSLFFVQVLSLCVSAFGSPASVALLLNCAAYLLTCAIITRIARTRNDIVLAAIACSPALILFSLQPLKDTLFLLLIAAMVAAFRRWEEWWRAGGTWATWAHFLGYALATCAVIYALAGIRWYFAVIACGAATIFLVLTAQQAQRRGWAFVTSAVLLLLLAQSIRLGAHDLPPSYHRLLNPMTALQWRPSATQKHLVEVRKGFDSTPGATTVAEGGALAKPEIAGTPATTIAEVQTQPPKIAPVAPASREEPASNVPPRWTSRIITGFAAMFLPRFLGESLGLIRVGGGRGLWLFAEADTLLFDLVLLYAIVHCSRSLRRGRAKMTATFVFCVLVFVMTAGPILYTVSNFGTLFRLRLMVYCIAAVLPVTLREIPLREEGDAVP
jgi:hypothetical protein